MSQILESSRREALFVAVVWILACGATCGTAVVLAYQQQSPVALMFGMPTWVFWSVIVPWFVCLVLTVWASFWGIRDEELDDPHALPTEGPAH